MKMHHRSSQGQEATFLLPATFSERLFRRGTDQDSTGNGWYEETETFAEALSIAIVLVIGYRSLNHGILERYGVGNVSQT